MVKVIDILTKGTIEERLAAVREERLRETRRRSDQRNVKTRKSRQCQALPCDGLGP